MPTPKIIQIGKLRYLAGMTWRSLDERPDKLDLRTEATSLSTTSNTSIDWYALRPVSTEIIQAGFSSIPTDAQNGRPGKLISLAAAAAGILQEPWLGIYQISEDLYWYIAVRDGHTILPNGDVIGTRAVIDEARNLHAGYQNWNEVEGGLSDLINLLERARATKSQYSKPVYIKTLYSAPIPKSVYIGTAITLTLIIGGAYLFHTYNLQKERELAQQVAAAQAALSLKKAEPVFLPPALISQPMPDEWIAACRATIGPTPLAQYGWSLTNVICAETTATLEWKRTDIATVAHHPEGTLSNDGNTIIGSLPINIKMESLDNRDTLNVARLSFQTWAQKRYLDAKLATDTQPESKALPGAVKPADQALTTVSQGMFSFSLPFPPDGMQLDSIPGARVSTLKFDMDKWEVSGVVYGK